jgi:uncharacterized membrane-anchored protein
MKKYKWIIILVNLIVLLGWFTNSIMQKETILSQGDLVLLKLAPVDPRSLMQGDYMSLDYAIAQDFDYIDSIPKRGYIVVRLDSQNIAQKVRLQTERSPLNEGEHLIEYTRAIWSLNIGHESYFFEEGQAEKFDSAEYGGLKIDDKGNSILIGLYNANFELIEK